MLKKITELINKQTDLNTTRENIVITAKTMIGKPSNTSTKKRNDGLGNPWFDCSGFVSVVLKMNGIDTKHRFTNELFDNFGILVHEGLHQAGDLVFFSKDGTYPSHVGIVISKNEYIHAPGVKSSKVEISTIDSFESEPVSDKSKLLYNTPVIGYKRVSLKNGRYHKL